MLYMYSMRMYLYNVFEPFVTYQNIKVSVPFICYYFSFFLKKKKNLTEEKSEPLFASLIVLFVFCIFNSNVHDT